MPKLLKSHKYFVYDLGLGVKIEFGSRQDKIHYFRQSVIQVGTMVEMLGFLRFRQLNFGTKIEM